MTLIEKMIEAAKSAENFSGLVVLSNFAKSGFFFDEVRRLIPPDAVVSRSRHEIKFANGSVIKVSVANSFEKVSGITFDGIVFDEMAKNEHAEKQFRARTRSTRAMQPFFNKGRVL